MIENGKICVFDLAAIMDRQKFQSHYILLEMTLLVHRPQIYLS